MPHPTFDCSYKIELALIESLVAQAESEVQNSAEYLKKISEKKRAFSRLTAFATNALLHFILFVVITILIASFTKYDHTEVASVYIVGLLVYKYIKRSVFIPWRISRAQQQLQRVQHNLSVWQEFFDKAVEIHLIPKIHMLGMATAQQVLEKIPDGHLSKSTITNILNAQAQNDHFEIIPLKPVLYKSRLQSADNSAIEVFTIDLDDESSVNEDGTFALKAVVSRPDSLNPPPAFNDKDIGDSVGNATLISREDQALLNERLINKTYSYGWTGFVIFALICATAVAAISYNNYRDRQLLISQLAAQEQKKREGELVAQEQKRKEDEALKISIEEQLEAKATDAAVTTYNEDGVSGLIIETQGCYEKNTNDLFYCVYLDLASRHIDQFIVEAMHFPPNDFFADDQFRSRIVPVVASTKMDMSTANQYLASTTLVINNLVEKKLLDKKSQPIISPDAAR